MKLVHSYLRNNLFFIRGQQLYRIIDKEFKPVDDDVFLKAPFPVLLIARENLTEVIKKYPVTDKSDLREIIRQEVASVAMLTEPEIREHDSVVKIWTPQSHLFERFSHKLFAWLPESLLLAQFDKDRLFQIQRCGSSVFSFNDINGNYTAARLGAFKSAEYFLMSIGAPVIASTEIQETDYAHSLYEQLFKISKSHGLAIVKAQQFRQKIAKMFNWPSILLGAFGGALLYYFSLIGFYAFNINQLEKDIADQNIASVIKTRQSILEKRKVFAEFANQDAGQNIDMQMWRFLGEVMQKDISIIKIRTTNEGMWVRLQSKVATDSLSYVKRLPYIKSASFANAVQNFRGQQRFNVNITFQANAAVNAASAQGTNNE